MISLPVDPINKMLNKLFPEAVVAYGYEKGTGYVRVYRRIPSRSLRMDRL